MSKTASRRAGFTLIEVLVALVIIALLVAAVFPTLTRQIDDAEPTRLASDLASIRTGLETFQVNVRETPSDLEDLTTAILTTDNYLVGSTPTAYLTKHVNRWKGPYIDASVTSTTLTDPVITTGFGSTIINGIESCDSRLAAACDETDPTFAVVELANMTTSEFDAVNELIDGTAEAGSSTVLGKLRGTASGTAMTEVFYYAVPLGN